MQSNIKNEEVELNRKEGGMGEIERERDTR